MQAPRVLSSVNAAFTGEDAQLIVAAADGFPLKVVLRSMSNDVWVSGKGGRANPEGGFPLSAGERVDLPFVAAGSEIWARGPTGGRLCAIVMPLEGARS